MPPRPLKVFLCHAHADRDPVPQGDDMRGLYSRLTQVSNGLCHGLADKSGLVSLECIIATSKPKSVPVRESVIKSAYEAR